MKYNVSVTNTADMDADVILCHCGRGTGECEDVGVVLKGGTNATFSGLGWSQFTYPDGHVCYDWLVVKTGSNNPPEPYFPFTACTLNNTDMGAIWEYAVKGLTPAIDISGRSHTYSCALR